MGAADTSITAMGVVASLVQVAAIVIGGPLLLGLMAKVRARVEGRVGAPIHQPLLDLRKQMRKERIHAEHSSAVLIVVPFVFVSTAAVAGAIAPLVTTRPALATSADILVIVYLLLAGSVALALAGLDAGTAFGGMGSSRAMTIGALAEPALLLAVVAMSIQSGTSNVPAIVADTLNHPGWSASPQRLLSLGALIIVVVAETGRIPVDNPSTHLELTMIHEAMTLEYAGPELGLVSLGESMRLGLLLALTVNLFIPWGVAEQTGGLAIPLGLAVLIAKVATLGVLISLFEVRSAKLRLFQVPELLAGAFVLAMLAIVAGLVTT